MISRYVILRVRPHSMWHIDTASELTYQRVSQIDVAVFKDNKWLTHSLVSIFSLPRFTGSMGCPRDGDIWDASMIEVKTTQSLSRYGFNLNQLSSTENNPNKRVLRINKGWRGYVWALQAFIDFKHITFLHLTPWDQDTIIIILASDILKLIFLYGICFFYSNFAEFVTNGYSW